MAESLVQDDLFAKLVFEQLDVVLSQEQKAYFESTGIADFLRVFCTALKEAGAVERYICPVHLRDLLRSIWIVWRVDKTTAFSVIKDYICKDIALHNGSTK